MVLTECDRRLSRKRNTRHQSDDTNQLFAAVERQTSVNAENNSVCVNSKKRLTESLNKLVSGLKTCSSMTDEALSVDKPLQSSPVSKRCRSTRTRLRTADGPKSESGRRSYVPEVKGDPRESLASGRTLKRKVTSSSPFDAEELNRMSSCFIRLQRVDDKRCSKVICCASYGSNPEGNNEVTAARSAVLQSALKDGRRSERRRLSLRRTESKQQNKSTVTHGRTRTWQEDESSSDSRLTDQQVKEYNAAVCVGREPSDSSYLQNDDNSNSRLSSQEHSLDNGSRSEEHELVALDSAQRIPASAGKSLDGRSCSKRGRSDKRLSLKLRRVKPDEVVMQSSHQQRTESRQGLNAVCIKNLEGSLKESENSTDFSERDRRYTDPSKSSELPSHCSVTTKRSSSVISPGESSGRRLNSVLPIFEPSDDERLDSCADVLYRLSVLSSPEPSDYDGSPPLPSSPTAAETVGCLRSSLEVERDDQSISHADSIASNQSGDHMSDTCIICETPPDDVTVELIATTDAHAGSASCSGICRSEADDSLKHNTSGTSETVTESERIINESSGVVADSIAQDCSNPGLPDYTDTSVDRKDMLLRKTPSQCEFQEGVCSPDSSNVSNVVWSPVYGPPSRQAILMDLVSQPYLVQSVLNAVCSDPRDMPAKQK